MALSLPGERSVATGSRLNPIGVALAWFARQRKARARRVAISALLELDSARLRDLGIERSDIADAMVARNGRTPGMVLNAARCRNARG
jgi:uncharacterized protein YjiS (DUF1127 family)